MTSQPYNAKLPMNLMTESRSLTLAASEIGPLLINERNYRILNRTCVHMVWMQDHIRLVLRSEGVIH